MTNISDKLIKDDYKATDTFRALYVSGANNLWATIKSGNKLNETNNQAIADGVISEAEINNIHKAENDFYFNLALLANNFLDFMKFVGATQLVIDGRNFIKNITDFSDGLNGDADDLRPHIDVAQFISVITDASSLTEAAIDTAKLKGQFLIIKEVLGWMGDVLNVINLDY